MTLAGALSLDCVKAPKSSSLHSSVIGPFMSAQAPPSWEDRT